ncbi:MAG: thiamine pyrophosphate-dependent enzyme, partial [Tissierellia bacterium]|nr:thiamine pyrophosphate-dependent enzyme [Tissierellia bacterium]
VLPLDYAVDALKKSIVAAYGNKGEEVVNMNSKAVDQGIDALVKIEVPADWANATEAPEDLSHLPEFVREVARPMNRQEGNSLPVSKFVGRENGEFPQGTSEFEKRGIALFVPEWQKEHCIQCNQCSYVCPHAVIRPFLVDENERANAPAGFETIKAVGKGMEEVEFRMQVSPLDCTGCGNCADVCPSKQKSLIMKPFEEQYIKEKDNWNYAVDHVTYKDQFLPDTMLKGSQFRQPLLEFSGACAGCGETPYAKLMTQLFGDRMMIANATGCSSIWGASAPATVYCKNKEGLGPAWANSLFEDNAEYGYGMALAASKVREKLQFLMTEFLELGVDSPLNEHFKSWIENIKDAKGSKAATGEILPLLSTKLDNERANELLKEIEVRKDYLIKRSVWILGGDGWAYDIGFGGLDHVLASGEDINILVFDTEVYSNTGGQASKATPTAAVAKFAASGKKVKKKDLGMIAASYGYVYVAQVAMGANMNQTLKAFHEAESYDGPSIIMAYSPCINHGIRTGMGTAQKHMKKAVEAGYWHLYRFDPRLKEEGKNPFVLDSKEPTGSFQDFIRSEVRYTSLQRAFPKEAEELFVKAEDDAKERYTTYKRMAEAE